MKLLDISISDDNILEGNETIVLSLLQDSLSNNSDIKITVGKYANATVNIVDTTSKCYNQ